MQKNDIIKVGGDVYRVLERKADKALLINCSRVQIPRWFALGDLTECEKADQLCLSIPLPDIESLDNKSRCIMNERYTMIAPIIPLVSDFRERNRQLASISADSNISRQTLINYLWLYLVYQSKAALAPKACYSDSTLTKDEKNYRWALNKYFYTPKKYSLKTAYTLMLKEKYCDSNGLLLSEYPTFNQFRYYYRKNMNLRNYYISRDGLKYYQRNKRPLLGDGVRELASSVGFAMLDSTICDIYLINDSGDLIGRPILTACIDAFSGLCMGYCLTWEGGVYSLRGLMLNVISDKQSHCKAYGIEIDRAEWDSSQMPAILITDKGAEYKSENFEQLAELGVKVINLPSFRPELKGYVEKFFDVVQDLYKPYLKGKGVIESDFQERGAHDYRRDACLTMREFETIIIRCIVYYNSKRIVKSFPFTDDMIAAGVKPYANTIFEYGRSQSGANLLSIDRQTLVLSLLPRTAAKFSRNGLIVNKMRYRNNSYTERYLKGGEAVAAYNPDDVSCVWLYENGAYTKFELIESRYNGKQLEEVNSLQADEKQIIKEVEKQSEQAQIDLASHILTIAANARKQNDVTISGIRANRQRETSKSHIDFMKAGTDDE